MTHCQYPSYYLAPGGGCELLFSPGLYICVSVCLSVCVYVCVCVSGRYLVFYFSAIRRDIDLKCMQDTYRVVLNSFKKMTFIGQGHRDGTLLFEGTVISFNM